MLLNTSNMKKYNLVKVINDAKKTLECGKTYSIQSNITQKDT